MAENYDLIFGQSASQQYAWSDSDYQNGWQTVGSTPPTAEQFDALQRKSDTKAKDLNDRLEPLETKATADGRQAATEYAEGVMVTADGLPNGWLLECIVAGTTGTGALVIPSPLVIGGTIVDGTVTWKLLNLAMGGVPVGYVTPFLQSTAPDGWLSCAGAEVSRAAYPDLWQFINGSSQLISEADWQTKNTAGEKNIGWFSSGDGTTTFRLPRIVGSGELTEVKRFTTAGAGSFTAPVTGIYKITLQGAGGGGAGATYNSSYGNIGGGGGGQGGHLEFYEKLTAGTSYSYTIGAGGAGGTAGAFGSNGGDSTITVGDNAYKCTGGGGGAPSTGAGGGGVCGVGKINSTIISYALAGAAGGSFAGGTNKSANGGVGGGSQGVGTIGQSADSHAGAGGSGGGYNQSGNEVNPGAAGGDGYIEFAYNPVPQYWYVRAFGSATNQGTIDITELANMLNAKLSISSVPLVAGYNAKQTFTSSGSFTAPVTGIYRITLQGGGGGAGGSGTVGTSPCSGAGGGQGGHYEFYESLTAGTTYSFTIGAGGSGGAAGTSSSNGASGSAGGDSSVVIGDNTYTATGGSAGGGSGGSVGGAPGDVKVNNTTIITSAGGVGVQGTFATISYGGPGGGFGGGFNGNQGHHGGGGSGGTVNKNSNIYETGGAGGDGYITFEWQTASLV